MAKDQRPKKETYQAQAHISDDRFHSRVATPYHRQDD